MVEKSSEVTRNLLERVFLRFIGFGGLTVTQHVRRNDTVASLNPGDDLVFPGSPEPPRMINGLESLLGKEGIPEVREPMNQEKGDGLFSIVVGR